jgi:hypothetical protein
MPFLVISGSGNFDKTERFLARLQRGDMYRNVGALAQRGVAALESATPQETGVTASSWSSEVQFSGGGCTIFWRNNHLDPAGTPIAIMLQTGHGTGTGGYVQGRDYINPAIRPVFDQIADAVWKEVTSDG